MWPIIDAEFAMALEKVTTSPHPLTEHRNSIADKVASSKAKRHPLEDTNKLQYFKR